MSKFITFSPSRNYDDHGHWTVCRSATIQLNEWLEEHPEVEIIHWQATPVGSYNEIYITVQYKEN